MAHYSPGPYSFEGNKILCGGRRRYAVASVNSHATREGAATGMLLATAPELLDFARAFRGQCDPALLVEDDHPQVQFRECLLTALQVIAQAEGEA